MNAHFHAMMHTLREARRALEAELASRGIDYLTYPRPRTYTLGARVQF